VVGRTLISDRHVLTAAHCLMDPDTAGVDLFPILNEFILIDLTNNNDRVVDDKEELFFNVYTVVPMEIFPLLDRIFESTRNTITVHLYNCISSLYFLDGF
jgi:V8-like Glu-specific endopeptidase